MLTDNYLRHVVEHAIAEDAPHGDITSQSLIPEDATATARMVARDPGVMAAADILPYVFQGCEVTEVLLDGSEIDAGDCLAVISGPAREVLLGERVALNFAQRLCGIATLTAEYVEAIAGTRARITDTRKTTPGVRELERHAVRCGGGTNHRSSLSDAVLVKDNHLSTLRHCGIDIVNTLRETRQRIPHTMRIEVEVDDLRQLETVLASEVVDIVMLDNFDLEDLVEGVSLVAGQAIVEASGGVSLDTVRAIAETGVDLISVGALTNGSPSLDIGLDFQ